MQKKRKNAFTLIELLAVIVILAIIALIATPIILGIVEDARKDAFLRSVELVVSTTDIDIANKTFEEMYTYEIVDGDISNLEIGVKNTKGMNGTITYDKNGNDEYAIHNGVYCVRKTSNMENVEISKYIEDECGLKEGKNVFLKRIESLVLATNSDVVNKLTNNGYRYELTDGILWDKKEVDYEISDTCETSIALLGAPESDISVVCSGQPYFDGLSITEFVLQNPEDSFAQQLVVLGAVTEVVRNHNELNFAENIEGMNGYIQYNVSGEEVYAIHNKIYCVKKKVNMNKAEISDYIEGKCNTNLTFPEFLDTSPTEGDKIISGNGQLVNLGKYGIRYQGYDPDNYVYFNCSDYSNPTSETCELWRIIGVVDGKIKLIRNESIGEYAWNDQDRDGNSDDVDINDWNNSTLKSYLNGEYYNTLLTRNEETKNIISPSTWYLRGHNTLLVTKDLMYDLERTTGTVLYETPQIDNTNIGVMYLSDFGFAAMEIGNADTTLDHYAPCKEFNWLSQGLTNQTEWLITPRSDRSQAVFNIYMFGDVVYTNAYFSLIVRPSLYLSSNIELQGEGTLNSPYKLQSK